jgi:hypothetical protein
VAPPSGRYAVIAVVYVGFMNLVVGCRRANILNGIALGSLYGIIGVAWCSCTGPAASSTSRRPRSGRSPPITALTAHDDLRPSAYLLTLPLAIVGGLGVGALTDLIVMRASPRRRA